MIQGSHYISVCLFTIATLLKVFLFCKYRTDKQVGGERRGRAKDSWEKVVFFAPCKFCITLKERTS